MAIGDLYRAKAADLRARANRCDSKYRAEFEALGAAYVRLAEQEQSDGCNVIGPLYPQSDKEG